MTDDVMLPLCRLPLCLQGRWFYALLSSLEKPLVPEASYLLRGLARNCANLRASLVSTEHHTIRIINNLFQLLI